MFFMFKHGPYVMIFLFSFFNVSSPQKKKKKGSDSLNLFHWLVLGKMSFLVLGQAESSFVKLGICLMDKGGSVRLRSWIFSCRQIMC